MGCCGTSLSSEDVVLSVNERYSPKVRSLMICRYLIRESFDADKIQQSGYFWDRQMNPIIYAYFDIGYLNGNHILDGRDEGMDQKIKCAVITTDGTQLYVGSGKNIMLWDLVDLRMIQVWQKEAVSLDYHPSGQLAVGSYTRVVIYDTISDESYNTMIHDISAKAGYVRNVKFVAKGDAIIFSSSEFTMHLVSLDTGQTIRDFSHGSYVQKIMFINDNNVVSGALDECLRVWDLTNGECKRVLHTRHPTSLIQYTMNRTRTKYAYCKNDGIRIYDWPDDGSTSYTYINQGARDLCFHPFYHHILALACLPDHEIKIYNVETKKCIRTFDGHFANITRIHFTPDGSRLVTVSADATIGLWDVSDKFP